MKKRNKTATEKYRLLQAEKLLRACDYKKRQENGRLGER